MKFILSLLFLTGHGAFATTHVEPNWWPLIESTFEGVRLNKCTKHEGIPPLNGSSCSHSPKTCFFGDQDCGGVPYPDEKCICSGAIWNCTPQQCPATPAYIGSCTKVRIDFEKRGDGSALARGEYVQDEWSEKYGISVSATSTTGFTPNGRPRLFDTSDPGTTANGDPDLGSPNAGCALRGPGVGAAGGPGQPGENCFPQGLVLIVQETDKPTPDDNAQGGKIFFDFEYPTDVVSVGLMDIGSPVPPTSIFVTENNGNVAGFVPQGLGPNSVENIATHVLDAKQVEFDIFTSGAVTHLDLCVHIPRCTKYLHDFDAKGDGSALAGAAYVKDEWSTEYGITVSATSATGFTPDDKPRLFDTSNPGTTATGDPDLGSPNQLCVPSGPGVGANGGPYTPGENCDPQGLVLIVQESDKPTPDDNARGGKIVFHFDYPTDVKSVGLMDIDSFVTQTSIHVTDLNYDVTTFGPQGLGENSVESIETNVWDAKKVEVDLFTSGAITHLDLCVHLPCTPIYLDFETEDDGSALAAGAYVKDEWSEYGITVSATSIGGWTPDGKPRLFNTTSPGTNANGDPDLGSPNAGCSTPGPGVGAGGAQGQPGENCDPQGLVLIVQESDKLTPDDNAGGGMIVFDFEYPTDVLSLGLMDIDTLSNVNTVTVKRTNGDVITFTSQALGENSVEKIVINVWDAEQVKVTFLGSGAITHLDLCAHIPPTPSVPITTGSSITREICIPTAPVPQNLEVCLLSDASGSFFDDQDALRLAAPGIANTILASSPGARFGYAAFIDTEDYFPEEFVYRLLQTLTTDVSAWTDAIDALVPNGGDDEPEAQYDGIACAVDISYCPTGIGYSTEDCGFTTGTSSKKVLVVTTDAPFSTQADIQNNEASTLQALTTNDVVLIGLKAPGADTELDALAAGTGGSIEFLMSNGMNVANAILSGLSSLTTTVQVDASTCSGFGVTFGSTSVEVTGGEDACFDVTLEDSASSAAGTEFSCVFEFTENAMVVNTYSVRIIIV